MVMGNSSATSESWKREPFTDAGLVGTVLLLKIAVSMAFLYRNVRNLEIVAAIQAHPEDFVRGRVPELASDPPLAAVSALLINPLRHSRAVETSPVRWHEPAGCRRSGRLSPRRSGNEGGAWGHETPRPCTPGSVVVAD